jgi:hypothetical protein
VRIVDATIAPDKPAGHLSGSAMTARHSRLRPAFPHLDLEAGTLRPSGLAFAVLSRVAGWTLTLMLPDDRLTSTLLLFRFWRD